MPTTTTTAVRVNIEESEACPVLNGFALFMDDVYVSYEQSNVLTGMVKSATEPLVLDMVEPALIKGFAYSPKQNGEDGVIVTYRLESSLDGNDWDVLAEEIMFDNIVNNPISQHVQFQPSIYVRFLRLIPIRVENTSGSSQTYGVTGFSPIF